MNAVRKTNKCCVLRTKFLRKNGRFQCFTNQGRSVPRNAHVARSDLRLMQNRHARAMWLVRVCHWWPHCLQCSVLTKLTGLVASNNAKSPF